MAGEKVETKEPRWRRRAADRPREIADAALLAFATRGYSATRLTDIARHAGVSKAALYNYYPTKSELFRAVLLDRVQLEVEEVTTEFDGPVAEMMARVLQKLARAISKPEPRKLARMVMTESGNFPEIAAAWREAVVGPAIEALDKSIRRAQARGEVRDGDARLMAFCVIGPMITAMIWREVIEPVGGGPIDLDRLAIEHASTLAAGLIAKP